MVQSFVILLDASVFWGGGYRGEMVISLFFALVVGDVDVSTLLEYIRAFPQRGGQASEAPPAVLGEQVHQMMESQLG